MTSACPQCRAPLSGPVCQICGLQVGAPVQPGTPYPQQMPYGQPMPYGQQMPYPMYPQGMPYQMGPPQPATHKMATIAGIMSLVASVAVIGACVWAYGNSDLEAHFQGARGMLGVTIAFAVATLVFAFLSMRGTWWGALTAGILQSLNSIMSMALAGAAIGARDKMRINEIFGDAAADPGQIHALEMLRDAFLFCLLGIALSAIFSYVAIGGARRAARYRAYMQASGAF